MSQTYLKIELDSKDGWRTLKFTRFLGSVSVTLEATVTKNPEGEIFIRFEQIDDLPPEALREVTGFIESMNRASKNFDTYFS